MPQAVYGWADCSCEDKQVRLSVLLGQLLSTAVVRDPADCWEWQDRDRQIGACHMVWCIAKTAASHMSLL
jgi:hypothetical protein